MLPLIALISVTSSDRLISGGMAATFQLLDQAAQTLSGHEFIDRGEIVDRFDQALVTVTLVVFADTRRTLRIDLCLPRGNDALLDPQDLLARIESAVRRVVNVFPGGADLRFGIDRMAFAPIVQIAGIGKTALGLVLAVGRRSLRIDLAFPRGDDTRFDSVDLLARIERLIRRLVDVVPRRANAAFGVDRVALAFIFLIARIGILDIAERLARVAQQQAEQQPADAFDLIKAAISEQLIDLGFDVDNARVAIGRKANDRTFLQQRLPDRAPAGALIDGEVLSVEHREADRQARQVAAFHQRIGLARLRHLQRKLALNDQVLALLLERSPAADDLRAIMITQHHHVRNQFAIRRELGFDRLERAGFDDVVVRVSVRC